MDEEPWQRQLQLRLDKVRRKARTRALRLGRHLAGDDPTLRPRQGLPSRSFFTQHLALLQDKLPRGMPFEIRTAAM